MASTKIIAALVFIAVAVIVSSSEAAPTPEDPPNFFQEVFGLMIAANREAWSIVRYYIGLAPVPDGILFH